MFTIEHRKISNIILLEFCYELDLFKCITPGNTDETLCFWEKTIISLCYWSQLKETTKKRGDWWTLVLTNSDGLINYTFSWTPAAFSKHIQANFLLSCSKAMANLHIYLMLFKKISHFPHYLISFSCFTLLEHCLQHTWWLDPQLKIPTINLHHDKPRKCCVSFLRTLISLFLRLPLRVLPFIPRKHTCVVLF